MNVIAVILHYGSIQYTIDCYNDFCNQEGNKIKQIIIIDNDVNNPLLMANDPLLTIIANKENGGYAKGNNIALKYINENFECDYVIIANNDIVLPNNKVVLNLLNEISVLKSKAISPRLTDSISNESTLVVNSRFYKKVFECLVKKNKLAESSILSGCFMLIEYKIFKTLNFIDESFFMYGEDDYLSFQLFLNNANPIRSKSTTIIHFGGVQNLSSVKNLGKLKLIGRNRILLLKKLNLWDKVSIRWYFLLSYLNGSMGFLIANNLSGLIAYSKGILIGMNINLNNSNIESLHTSGKRIFLS